ncbi:outer membrane protein [Salipiger marinus]|jgi:outer membrane immunogenic protein|uniref:outer membrane protein n=1 Tax=Salipiger marinus TaxID=555512 RepID=UPI001E381F3A|nr:outer membrane beta-barrel protein [Salipiger manganoxidans]MCD1620179.1 porin family protein [Salipiger manganoxidans]MEB3421154.1 outer membrane beta-barrel protein [Salipiger manganoxidans]
MKFSRIALPALLIGGFAAPALAGNLEATPVEPVIATPAPVPAAPLGRDWTGPSAGIQLGYGGFNTDESSEEYEEKGVYGARLNYDHDFGSWVGGAGMQYDRTDADLGNAGDLDGIFRLGARAGYDAGNTLIYGTGGYAKAFTDGGTLDAGDSDGYYVGLGTETFVSDNWTLGTELTYNEFKDFDDSDLELDATQLNVSLNYRF